MSPPTSLNLYGVSVKFMLVLVSQNTKRLVLMVLYPGPNGHVLGAEALKLLLPTRKRFKAVIGCIL